MVSGASASAGEDPSAAVLVRAARATDRGSILELCRESLGWQEGDPNEEFFAWKHDDNAFGSSPTWIAENPEGRMLGVRCFLRWRFRDSQGGTFEAVRAVDTATRPDARGLGIFTRLTVDALPQLRDSGVRFVFNTPNEQSRPGYLKMGWSVVGQYPLGVRPTRVFPKRNKTTWSGSDKWGVRTTAGTDPSEAFADERDVERLINASRRSGGIHTDRTVQYLRWRYGFGPLGYRVLAVGTSIADGAVVFRLRRRGERLDVTVCDEMLPRPRLVDPLYRRLARETGADLLMRTQTGAFGRGPFLRVRRLGPLLTWRPLDDTDVPSIADLDLTYGDLELF